MVLESTELLCQKLKAIRIGNSVYRRGKSLSAQEMIDKINEIIKNDKTGYYQKNDIADKERTFIRDLEDNKKKKDVLMIYADLYFEVFELPKEVREQILNAAKVVVLDTTALMNMPHIVKTFGIEFYKIIICDFVMDELERNKNNAKNYVNSKKARKAINELLDCQEKVVYMDYTGDEKAPIADRMKKIAKDASEKYICNAILISDDKNINARYLGIDDSDIEVVSLKEYSAKRQKITTENIDKLIEIREKKKSFEGEIGLSKEEMNYFFIDGRTLISSTILDKDLDNNDKINKIKWLIDNGADVNRTDCASDFFPPLTTAIQSGNYELFHFLLNDCNANPNIGSFYPYHNRDTIGLQNEGNTPLMVAAYHGYSRMVKELCMHNDISINQQDRNGYTALIKAHLNCNDECISILQEYGADKKIRELRGKTASELYGAGYDLKKEQDRVRKEKQLNKNIKWYKKEIEKAQNEINQLK